MRPTIVIIIALAVSMLVLGAGCGHQRVPLMPYDGIWVSAASEDSLGLAAFRRLSALTAAARREQAHVWLDRAARVDGVAPRVRCLSTAAGLAPDDPDIWMSLSAETSRLGDKRLALEQLDAAEAAIMVRAAADRRALRLRLAKSRAWLYRDRAQWTDAHAWADSAAHHSPGEREAIMLQGLTRASHSDLRGAFNISREIERIHFFRFEWRWIRGMAELAQGSPENAYHWLRDARPDGDYAARFYRDLALVCERLDTLVEARRFHGYSYAALDLEPGVCPEPAEVIVGRDEGRIRRAPVWIGLGRLYTAGSLYGAARAAVDSFNLVTEPDRHALWADRAQDLLSICIRDEQEVVACRRERGLLYSAMGFPDLALADVRRVVSYLERTDDFDPEIFTLYGHLLNGEGDHTQALTYLQRVVDERPDQARAWSALGFSLLMTAQESAGETALDRAIALDADLPEAWYNRGLAHYFAHRWAEAARDLERALDLAPDNPEILPLLQQSKGRVRRAERDAQQADPETP
jgi:tetratricopeptide (TPR) repeat protein